MPHENQFGLFIQGDKGPLYWGFFDDLEAAKKAAQEGADKEGLEFFVFSFKDFTEVARFNRRTREGIGCLSPRWVRGLRVWPPAANRDGAGGNFN